MNSIESISLSNPSEHEQEITITISSHGVVEEYEKALQSVCQNASRPGFRKGKMPKNMVENLYLNQIKKLSVERLVDKSLKKALNDKSIHPLSQPILKESDDLTLEKPFTFKVSFEVKPPVKIVKFKNFNLSIAKFSFDEGDVEQELEQIRDSFATFKEPIERNFIGENDLVFAKSEVKIDDVFDKSYSQKENRIPMFAKDVPENIKAALLGKKMGETVIVPHQLPKNNEEEQNNKSCELFFTILSIKEKILPKLDDDFAKDFSSEFSSLEDLKESIRKRFKLSLARRNEFYEKEAITKALIEANPVDAPSMLIEKATISLIKKELERFDKKTADKIIKESLDKLWKSYEPRAIINIKAELLYEELINKLNITASEEKVKDILKSYKDISKEDAVYSVQVGELINIIKNESHITYIDESINKHHG